MEDMDTDFNCSFCDRSFHTEEAKHVHEGDAHPSRQVLELEQLLDTFESGADKAHRIKQEKERLERRVEQLREETEALHSTVDDLRTTRSKLRDQLQEKEDELRDLQEELDKRAGQHTDPELKQRITELENENQDLQSTIDETDALFKKLKDQAEQLEDA